MMSLKRFSTLLKKQIIIQTIISFFFKVMADCRQSPKFEVLFSVFLFYINRTNNFERDLNDEKTSH